MEGQKNLAGLYSERLINQISTPCFETVFFPDVRKGVDAAVLAGCTSIALEWKWTRAFKKLKHIYGCSLATRAIKSIFSLPWVTQFPLRPSRSTRLACLSLFVSELAACFLCCHLSVPASIPWSLDQFSASPFSRFPHPSLHSKIAKIFILSRPAVFPCCRYCFFKKPFIC